MGMDACGQRHTLLLTSQGKVLASGENSDGQCGRGEMKSKDVECNKGNEEVETCNIPMLKDFDEINFNGPPVIKIAAGVDFSMLLDIDGSVWTGLNDTMDTHVPTWVSALDHPRGEIDSVQ